MDIKQAWLAWLAAEASQVFGAVAGIGEYCMSTPLYESRE